MQIKNYCNSETRLPKNCCVYLYYPPVNYLCMFLGYTVIATMLINIVLVAYLQNLSRVGNLVGME